MQASLMVACLKRLLPVGLNLFAGREQELVQHCKDRFLKKMPEYEIAEFAKTQLTLPDKIDPADEMSWQHYLYSKLGQKKDAIEPVKTQLEDVVARITDMAKVLYGLHMVSQKNHMTLLRNNLPNCSDNYRYYSKKKKNFFSPSNNFLNLPYIIMSLYDHWRNSIVFISSRIGHHWFSLSEKRSSLFILCFCILE